MTKRILTIVLALVMALGCFSAIAEGYEPALTASAVVFGSIGYPPTTDNYGTHLIEDTFNIHLDILPVDTGTDDNWNTFWIDGYADIIVPYSYGAILPLLNEDICRTYPIEWLEEYCPNMWQLLLKLYGTKEEIFAQLNYKGEIYCIPYFAMTNGISWINSIRNDWLEAVNLSVPTTLDELTALMDAFTNGDPDGNGVNDTYACSSTPYGLYNVAAAFGTSDVMNYIKDDEGKITTNAVSEEYKAWLAQMAEWYAAGYIDPEYVTDGRADVRAKYAQGKIGMYSDNPWWFEKGRGDIGPLQMVIANNPNLDLATGFSFFDNIQNPDGEILVNSLFGNIQGQAAIYFGYDCSDEIVIRMLQLQNERTILHDGTEEDIARIKLRATMDTGVEGVDWNYDPDADAIVTTEEYIAKTTGNPGYGTENGMYIFPCSQDMNMKQFVGQEDEFVIQLYEWSMSTNKIWRSQNFVLPILSSEGQDKKDLVSSCFDSFKNDIITGKKTIEADWDAYVAEMESLGMNEVIAEYESLI